MGFSVCFPEIAESLDDRFRPPLHGSDSPGAYTSQRMRETRQSEAVALVWQALSSPNAIVSHRQFRSAKRRPAGPVSWRNGRWLIWPGIVRSLPPIGTGPMARLEAAGQPLLSMFGLLTLPSHLRRARRAQCDALAARIDCIIDPPLAFRGGTTTTRCPREPFGSLGRLRQRILMLGRHGSGRSRVPLSEGAASWV
jgi:hypothetical protein